MTINGINVNEETDRILETAQQSNTAATIVIGTDFRTNPITIAIDENPPAMALINKDTIIEYNTILIEKLSLTIGKIDSAKKNIVKISKLLNIIPPIVNKVTSENLE